MEEVGGRSARWVMGFKEGTCYDEPWVLYVSDGSLNPTPETSIALYVIYLKLKLKNNKVIYFFNDFLLYYVIHHMAHPQIPI